MFSLTVISNSNMFTAVIFLFLINCVKGDSPKVSTEYGEIHGFRYETSNGFKAEAFLGIPFAQPPIGDLRFEVNASTATPSTVLSRQFRCGSVSAPTI